MFVLGCECFLPQKSTGQFRALPLTEPVPDISFIVFLLIVVFPCPNHQHKKDDIHASRLADECAFFYDPLIY